MTPGDRSHDHDSGESEVVPPEVTAREALDWAHLSGAVPALIRNEKIRARRRRRKRMLAAGMAVVVVAALSLHFGKVSNGPPEVLATPPAVAIKRPETRDLSDGSTVELRPGSEVSVKYGPTERRLVLELGEAHFDVQSDKSRPFVVVVAGVEVRAVGTAFSVSRNAGSVEVLVTEGRVTVGSVADGQISEPTQRRPLLLDADETVVIPLTGKVDPVVRTLSQSEQRARLDWRVPTIEFVRTSLAEAVPLFNRYGNVHLEFDPAVGGLKLSGSLRADDIASLLTLLHNEFGLIVHERPGNGLYLRRP